MQELYNSICKLLCQLIRSYNDAMILCQSWGFNGFKRKYRYLSHHLFNWKLCLENELFDKYRVIVSGNYGSMPYEPRSFKDHFTQWDKFLKENIDTLIGISKQFIDLTGFENCTIKDIVKCLLKDYEKVGRYIKRFNEAGWNPIDMHNVDDCLHEKMKKKEKKAGY